MIPGNTILIGERLQYGQFLVSLNGCFNATIALDGNLVVYKISTNEILWNLGFKGLEHVGNEEGSVCLRSHS